MAQKEKKKNSYISKKKPRRINEKEGTQKQKTMESGSPYNSGNLRRTGERRIVEVTKNLKERPGRPHEKMGVGKDKRIPKCLH